MISLLEPAGGLYRQRLEEITEPDFFNDLNLQAYVDAVMADEETKDLKPYFYLFPGNAETAEYRQSVSKELCDPDIRTAVNHFITGITVAERYLGFSEKTNGTQKWKWRLDTIVRYYDSIEEFCNALNDTPPKSQAFYSLHQSLSEFLNGAEAVSHEESYFPFCANITDLVRPGENELSVTAVNDLSRRHPWGKQKENRGGMWYTPVSGIWQTVWLEPVPAGYIRSLEIRTGSDYADISVEGAGDGTVELDGRQYPLAGGTARIQNDIVCKV